MDGVLNSLVDDETASVLDALSGVGTTTMEAKERARNILDDYYESDSELQKQEQSALSSLEDATEGVRSAIRDARMKLRGAAPQKSDIALSVAAALAQPTRTGSFGETMSNALSTLVGSRENYRQAALGHQNQLLELDTAEAGLDRGLAETRLEQLNTRRGFETDMAQEAMRVLGRKTQGAGSGMSAGQQSRQEKIQDAMRLFGVDEATATGVVDGHIRIELVEGTPYARKINTLDGSVEEIRVRPDIDPGSMFGDNYNIATVDPEYIDPFTGQDIRTKEEILGDQIARSRMEAGESLWDMASDATGPFSTVEAGVEYVSSLFNRDVPMETVEARQGLRIRARDLARALIDNPRMPVALVEMAIQDAAMSPRFRDTPVGMQTRMVALDRELWDRYLDAREDNLNPNNSPEFREEQGRNARAIATFLRDLNVPKNRQERRFRYGGSRINVPRRGPNRASQEVWDQFTDDEKKSYVDALRERAAQGEF